MPIVDDEVKFSLIKARNCALNFYSIYEIISFVGCDTDLISNPFFFRAPVSLWCFVVHNSIIA
jgi:hypothetical protein